MQPMASIAAVGGVHSALVNSGKIASQAMFVPVAGQATAAGAAAVGAVGTLTVAAPLMMMAVAVGASAYADHKRE
ncbi:hypothetical protein ACVWWN_007572 [Mycobacterium sp. URHB0021]|jgi:hypothetical protein